MDDTANRKKNWLLRGIVDIALMLHLTVAAIYWWVAPQGFPADFARFWLNTVFPFVIISIAVIGLVAMHRRHWPLAAATVLSFSTMWLAGAIAGRAVFPMSLQLIWLVAVAIGTVGFACFCGLVRGEAYRYGRWLLVAAGSAIVGAYPIWALIAPAASTVPLDEHPPVRVAQNHSLPHDTANLGNGYKFDARNCTLELSRENLHIFCQPLLNFDRISSDRFWSIFAPSVPPISLIAMNRTNGDFAFQYSDGGCIYMPEEAAADIFAVTVYTPVEHDTYSHLNTYCVFQISGHTRLSLVFSPCPETQIEVLPSEYPVGLPSRFAYVDRTNRFCVVEASSGEKGPFRELAAGPLERGTPLTITLCDDAKPITSFTLEDWSRQASTDLSPTAGWGVPMNAIEFSRYGTRTDSPVTVWITLAGTSVGRGWDTVGHRAGIYRNRIVFQTTSYSSQ